MTRFRRFSRRGITLMEVLIAIGILAIGLTSVVSLVPAGKSEAGKAVMLDRGGNLAMNVLEDAVTFGLTRPASIAFQSGVSHTSALVIFDPLIARSGSFVWSGTTPVSLPVSGTLRPEGVLASGPYAAVVDDKFLTTAILEGRDDLLYEAPVSDDAPPTNALVDGVRSYQGRTTALVSLAAISGTLTPGSLAKLTAVVFHGRNFADATDAVVSGEFDTSGNILGVTPPEGRSLKDAIRPGTVVYCPSAPPSQAWYQVAMASVDEGNGVVYVTFVDDVQPPPGPIQIALDSVGLAERIVTLEGSSPYAQ